MHKGLPQILVTIGHQHLLNKFSFVKAYLLVSVAATINCVPENLLRTVYHGFVSERSRANLPNLKGNLLLYCSLAVLLNFSSYARLHPSNPYEQFSVCSSMFFSKLTNDMHMRLCLYLGHSHPYIFLAIHYTHTYTHTPQIGFVIYSNDVCIYFFCLLLFSCRTISPTPFLTQLHCFGSPSWLCGVLCCECPTVTQTAPHRYAFTLFLGSRAEALQVHVIQCIVLWDRMPTGGTYGL